MTSQLSFFSSVLYLPRTLLPQRAETASDEVSWYLLSPYMEQNITLQPPVGLISEKLKFIPDLKCFLQIYIKIT